MVGYQPVIPKLTLNKHNAFFFLNLVRDATRARQYPPVPGQSTFKQIIWNYVLVRIRFSRVSVKMEGKCEENIYSLSCSLFAVCALCDNLGVHVHVQQPTFQLYI